MKSSIPLWIIATALSLILALFLLVLVGCAGVFFVVIPYQEHQRKQEIIKREPWRQLLPDNGFDSGF